MLRRGNKIRKRIALVPQPPRVVPRLAKFTATANMGDGKNHAAIKQAHAVRAEIHRDRMTVAAVTVKQKRRRAVQWRVPSTDERNRHARPIFCRGVKPFAYILRGVVSAKHRLLFAKRAFARSNVVVKHGTRRNEGLILVTHKRRIELRIASE